MSERRARGYDKRTTTRRRGEERKGYATAKTDERSATRFEDEHDDTRRDEAFAPSPPSMRAATSDEPPSTPA